MPRDKVGENGLRAPRVLFGSESFADRSWSELGSRLPGWEIRTSRGDELSERLAGVDVVCPWSAEVTAEMIAGSRFGLIQQYGVGVDQVAVDAATRAGVWVCRLPAELTTNADSVAELVVLHVLALLRRLDDSRAVLADGGWGQPVGRSLVGSTTVLVGLGGIGTAVAHRLAGFGTRLLGVRAHPERGGPELVERVVGPASMSEVLGEADVVVCSAMGSARNNHLFDRRTFSSVKPGAVFVNVARGNLVDESALCEALDSGRIAAAGLDVFAVEPASLDNPLIAHPRVLATPHIGALTETMFQRSGVLFADNLARWLRGERPHWAVNAPSTPRPRPSG